MIFYYTQKSTTPNLEPLVCMIQSVCLILQLDSIPSIFLLSTPQLFSTCLSPNLSILCLFAFLRQPFSTWLFISSLPSPSLSSSSLPFLFSSLTFLSFIYPAKLGFSLNFLALRSNVKSHFFIKNLGYSS